jgi:hypothetical protein
MMREDIQCYTSLLEEVDWPCPQGWDQDECFNRAAALLVLAHRRSDLPVSVD